MSGAGPPARTAQNLPWAKIPQGLITDSRVSAEAVRLYARLRHYMFRHHHWRKPLPKDAVLAADLHTTTRSVRRWRRELADAGWASFEFIGTVPAAFELHDDAQVQVEPRTNLSAS